MKPRPRSTPARGTRSGIGRLHHGLEPAERAQSAPLNGGAPAARARARARGVRFLPHVGEGADPHGARRALFALDLSIDEAIELALAFEQYASWRRYRRAGTAGLHDSPDGLIMTGSAGQGRADQAVAGDDGGESFLAPAFGAGGAFRQHQVAQLRGAVVDHHRDLSAEARGRTRRVPPAARAPRGCGRRGPCTSRATGRAGGAGSRSTACRRSRCG